MFDGDVVKSDSAIPTLLKEALQVATVELEDVPDAHQDWHPGSDKTVLDLIHLSLFPVVFRVMRILKDSLLHLDDCIKRCEAGEVSSVPPAEEAQILSRGWREPTPLFQNPYSQKFQWLPCDVALDGNNVK